MKNLVVLKIFKSKDNPAAGVMSINGIDYKLEITSTGNLKISNLRTNEVYYDGTAPGTYPTGTPVTFSFFSERTHPVFALYNIDAAHQIVHTKYSNPNPADWTIVVYSFDVSQVIGISPKEI